MSRLVLSKAVRLAVIVVLSSSVTLVAEAQRGGDGGGGGRGRGAAGGGGGASADTTTGFAIKNREIIANCSGCHVRDSAGHMQRLSYERKTPEGWEMSVRRMVGLNK